MTFYWSIYFYPLPTVKDAVRKAEAAASLAAEHSTSVKRTHKTSVEEKMTKLGSEIEDDSSLKEGHAAKKVNLLMNHIRHSKHDDEGIYCVSTAFKIRFSVTQCFSFLTYFLIIDRFFGSIKEPIRTHVLYFNAWWESNAWKKWSPSPSKLYNVNLKDYNYNLILK